VTAITEPQFLDVHSPLPALCCRGESALAQIARAGRNQSASAGTGRDFLAAKIPIRTKVQLFPFAEANRALNAPKHDSVKGAAVLHMK